MDYEALMDYMITNEMAVSCPTWEDRKIVIDKLKELNPDVDTRYLSREYDSTRWPRVLPESNPYLWVLTFSERFTVIDIPEFLTLCDGSQDLCDVSVDLVEVV